MFRSDTRAKCTSKCVVSDERFQHFKITIQWPQCAPHLGMLENARSPVFPPQPRRHLHHGEPKPHQRHHSLQVLDCSQDFGLIARDDTVVRNGGRNIQNDRGSMRGSCIWEPARGATRPKLSCTMRFTRAWLAPISGQPCRRRNDAPTIEHMRATSVGWLTSATCRDQVPPPSCALKTCADRPHCAHYPHRS